MMRVTSLLSRSAAVALITSALLSLAASTAHADAAFRARRSSTATIPSFFGVATGDKIVVYSLPATAARPEYMQPVGATFDLAATTTGATEPVTGFGMIGTVSGTAITFTPPAIAGGAAPPNNIPYALTPTSNNGLDIMYAVTNVQSGGAQSIGVIALNEQASTNITLTNNDGLANIPITVAPGTGFDADHISTHTLTFGTDETYTGFINAAGQIVTNPAQHVNATIEVRESRRGDMNGDGPVNGFDVNGFVAAVVNAGAYQTANPHLRVNYIGDFDNSGAINGFDVQAFVAAIVAGSPAAGSSPSAVPEPSTWALVGLGLGALLVRRLRRRS
jgi:hypothetical protein